MARGKFDNIRKVLHAMERAETARLKAKLNEVHSARDAARSLRESSAAEVPKETAADMQAQSRHQQHSETRARGFEQMASNAEGQAAKLRESLAVTLGRGQAAALIATKAAEADSAERTRRAESVPLAGRSYGSPSSDGTE